MIVLIINVHLSEGPYKMHGYCPCRPQGPCLVYRDQDQWEYGTLSNVRACWDQSYHRRLLILLTTGSCQQCVLSWIYLSTHLFHHPHHQRAEKVKIRAENVFLLPGTSFHLVPGTSNADIPGSISSILIYLKKYISKEWACFDF